MLSVGASARHTCLTHFAKNRDLVPFSVAFVVQSFETEKK